MVSSDAKRNFLPSNSNKDRHSEELSDEGPLPKSVANGLRVYSVSLNCRNQI